MRFPLLALLLGAATPLAAQSKSIAPSPSRLFALEVGGAAIAPADTLPKIGDHRVTGAVIGGGMGGAIGLALGLMPVGGDATADDCPSSGCYEEDSEILRTAAFTLGGAAIGAGLGYLMGRSTPRAGRPENVQPVTPVQDTGIKWWQGGLIGLGVGVATGAGIGKYYDENHDCGCDDPGMGVYTGAFLGGLVGMLVGAGVAQDNLPTDR